MRRLEAERRIPILPVYVDSPMANEALKFYAARTSELDEDMRPTERKVSTFATTSVSDGRFATAIEGARPAGNRQS